MSFGMALRKKYIKEKAKLCYIDRDSFKVYICVDFVKKWINKTYIK